MANAPTSVTVQQVRDLSLAGLFATVPEVAIARFIQTAANLLGSAYAQAHEQREDGVLYLATHLLWLQLKAEAQLSGGGLGGGGVGVASALSLVGVGSVGFAVSAQSVDDINDWMKAWSPWSVPMHAIIDSFGPAMFVTGMDGTEIA